MDNLIKHNAMRLKEVTRDMPRYRHKTHQQHGQRYTRDEFNSRWQKARDAAKTAFPELAFDFTFHDLKAKETSDLEGSISDKQKISGHKATSQTARYDRKIEIVPVVGGQ